jgi:hypothetical protein
LNRDLGNSKTPLVTLGYVPRFYKRGNSEIILIILLSFSTLSSENTDMTIFQFVQSGNGIASIALLEQNNLA